MKKTILINILVTTLMPFVAQAQSLAPLSENQMYSIITVSPDTRANEKLAAVTAKIKEKLNTIGQQVMTVASLGLLAPKSMNSAFATLGTSLQTELKPFAMEINKYLPEDSEVFSVYVMPYTIDADAKRTTLPIVNNVQLIDKDLGVIADTAGDRESRQKAAVSEFYSGLKAQITEISKVKNDKFQFAAAAAHIKLARNYVEVKIQMLGELKSGSTEFPKANKQVVINELEILSDEAQGLRPMAILQVTQKIPTKETDKLESPQIRIDLGAFGGISGGYGTHWKGEFQVLENPINPKNTCDLKFNSVPSFFGFLAEEPTGILIVDKFLQNKPVRFRVFAVIIDAETLKVKNMIMATQIGVLSADPSEMATQANDKKIFNCLSMASVGEQFTSEANLAIEDALKEITSQNDVTPELMNALYE